VIKPTDPPGAHIEETLESLRLDFWRPGDDRTITDKEMGIGFAGMFERMALGGRLLSAVGWPRYAKVQPVAGLDALGLSWTDLLEPEGGGVAASVIPLEVVLKKAAAIDAARDPIAMLRLVFGDLGVASIEELVAAAAGPVDPTQDARRQAALAAIGLTPQGIAREPLASLATIVRMLESKPGMAAQRAAAAEGITQAMARVTERQAASAAFMAQHGAEVINGHTPVGTIPPVSSQIASLSPSRTTTRESGCCRNHLGGRPRLTRMRRFASGFADIASVANSSSSRKSKLPSSCHVGRFTLWTCFPAFATSAKVFAP
jgi:hypothetical protein